MKLPDNPTIGWLKRLMKELNLNSDRVIEDMCYKEFFEAYPDYVPVAMNLIEKSDGPKSFYAYNMYKHGIVTIAWMKKMIEEDNYSKENNLLYVLNKLKDEDDDINNKYEQLLQKKTDLQLNKILNEHLGGI